MDDIYLTVDSISEGKTWLTWAIDRLRRDNLYLNELKSGLRLSESVRQEENEVTQRFLAAVNEINESGVNEYIEVPGYGFRVAFEEPSEITDIDEASAEQAITAIRSLMAISVTTRPDIAVKVDRFIFPLLAALRSNIAIERAFVGISAHPYLSHQYAAYMAAFVGGDQELSSRVARLIKTDGLGDYEQMLLLSVLQNSTAVAQSDVNHCLTIMADTRKPQPVRALAAIVAAKFGTAQQQRAVVSRYEDEDSPYMRCALLYATRYMSAGDRNTCRRVWGAHSQLNGIMAAIVPHMVSP
jgi:hypothetical protein